MRAVPTLRLDPSAKQSVAWALLEKSDQITDVYYGGAAGGGKTFLGCAWQIVRRVSLPGSRGCIFRRQKKRLKETTMVTFHKTAQMMGLIRNVHYKHPGSSDTVTFFNGSTITLLDLDALPSDPSYERLGGYEFTDAFGDEVSECPEEGVSILQTRIRWMVDHYGLEPKILMTSNPTKRWVYRAFYQPWRNNALKPHQAFVQALLTDNPNEGWQRVYRKQLMKRTQADQRRLLQGLWEFEDDPLSLVSYDAVADVTRNIFVPRGAEKQITADVALQGSDRCVVAVWDGWRMERVVVCEDLSARAVESLIRKVSEQERIPLSSVVVDASGIGAFLPDYLEGVRAYVGGAAAPGKERYFNLRSKCGFIAAEKIRNRELYVNRKGAQTYNPKTGRFTDAPAVLDMLTHELELLRRVDRDDKMQLLPKEEMKKDLGRSPDLQDVVLMRGYAEAHGFRVLASTL